MVGFDYEFMVEFSSEIESRFGFELDPGWRGSWIFGGSGATFRGSQVSWSLFEE